jgi:ornithine carbamoyltransferase
MDAIAHSDSSSTAGTMDLAAPEACALLAKANALVRAARSGAVLPALRGKNIAMVTELADGPDAALLVSAAAQLGALVAHVRPSLSESSQPEEVAHTARLLGRLYDAVALLDASDDVVRKVAEHAGVPVFGCIESARCPLTQLAAAVQGVTSDQEGKQFLVQALLLTALL